MNLHFLMALTVVLWSTSGMAQSTSRDNTAVDEITVFGQGRPIRDTHYASPTSTLTPDDLVSINAMTTEDLVRFEPDLVIRRRYIGDPNGTMGMRGSNMFQTTRSMVFADGIPLHYLLQTQYNGSPRWSLVAADEIARIDVVYGPYSAEYSGNAMGGVVNIETRIPTERRVHVEGSMFSQAFEHQGYDDDLNGERGFISYGDRFGAVSIYTAYSHLQNRSQPMDFLFDAVSSPAGDETAVTGARDGSDEYGAPVIYYGDTGSQRSVTDQWKTKVGYEWNDWLALGTVAYEKRSITQESVNTNVSDATGAPVWNGRLVDNGTAFEVASSDFAVGEQDRRSLLLGGRLQGKLSEQWWLEASVSDFRILRDESRDSNANPLDPAYTADGSVAVYDNTGWQTADIKVQNDRAFGSDTLSLVAGLAYEHYELGIDNFTSSDYIAGEQTSAASASGGETTVQAAYVQLNWQINDAIDAGFGGRLERWRSADGYYYDFTRDNLQDHADRSETRFSPKFTVGYLLTDTWQLRYSLAQAYRFPIVEELFQNERRTNDTSIANANLEPEDGVHHNLMLERSMDGGYLRLNVFGENIRDVIFNQTAIVDNRAITTFLPVDEVRTRGVELVVNRSYIASRLDLRFNTAYVHSEIHRNDANPALQGNAFPRMPEWRVNLLATWHVNDRWDIGGGVRHASNSYGDLDNADVAHRVFGAQDAYTQISLKSGYAVNDRVRVNVGIDNLTNDIAFVHHPWPGRTVYLEAAVDL